MNVYTTDRIRNVVLLGHGGCGKTSLVEAMAYLAGMTSRMGKVEDGNTISDYDKEEMKRHFSINTSVVPIIWEDTKINILDTPGYFDFVGETEEAVSAADAAIIVVSGKAGIEVGTRKAWELCEQYKLPRMVFVTDMDIDEASYRQVVQDLAGTLREKRSHRSICRSVRTDSSSATSTCCSSGRSAGRRTARLRRRTFRIIQRRILASAERL